MVGGKRDQEKIQNQDKIKFKLQPHFAHFTTFAILTMLHSSSRLLRTSDGMRCECELLCAELKMSQHIITTPTITMLIVHFTL
jgi:hypothetical protein